MEKQYVRVNGNWEDDGSFIPLFILWENGLKYKIEKIVQRDVYKRQGWIP